MISNTSILKLARGINIGLRRVQPVGDKRRKLHKLVEPRGNICRGEVLI